ncbi:hypothetical protein H0H93_016291 [Arthromyces matolae]|nr:hypothetical protein H0H93_016291 [Arthromyces matolae]
MGKGKGVSRSVTRYIASHTVAASRRQQHLKAQALAEVKAQAQASDDTLQVLRDNAPSNGLSDSSGPDMPMDDSSNEWEDVAGEVVGEEFTGEEGNSIFVDLRDLVTSRWKHRVYVDHRTWKARQQAFFRNWNAVLNDIVHAYLTWSADSRLPFTTSSDDNITSSDNEGTNSFTITVIDVHSLASTATIPRTSDDSSSIIDLARAGYIGNSPVEPSCAVSIRTLELFRALRLFRPSFSVEAFAKTLAHLYTASHLYLTSYNTNQTNRSLINENIAPSSLTLSTLTLQSGGKLTNVLVPSWEATHPTTLEGEPDLVFRRMLVMDGNNSLKRIKGIGNRQVADPRQFESSDYFLSADYVDQFANEVKARPTPIPATATTPSTTMTMEVEPQATGSNGPEPNDKDNEGDPTDGVIDMSGCTDNWKAAASDEKKKMWAIFDEAGIFACACRHGFVLWLIDMVRSGELAKYSLAIVAKALALFGNHILFGYDIGCRLEKTISTTSLAESFANQQCRCCVNAFHGFTHNYLCQLYHHPNNIVGMGLEDLETLERVFSSSNGLGSITRYMTAFRRRMFIDLHFQQWDAEKYANLATMLHQNYVQALHIIENNDIDVGEVLRLKGLTEDNLVSFIEDERTFFSTLGKEPDDDLHAIAYVELLHEFWDVDKKLDNASSLFRLQVPQDYYFISPERSYAQNLSETRRADTTRRHLNERHEKISVELIQMEERMNISERWTPSTSEYIKTSKYMSERNYEKALDKLQKLVIQRLFELHKLNLASTAYRARSHIAKSLQSRSQAIRNAVKQYNAAATSLGRPTLDWTKVSHYSFLDEFNLLRNNRANVHERPWSDPVIRETMRKYQRLQRAKEERERCNIELRRLHTSIRDEYRHFASVMKSLDGSDPISQRVLEHIRRRRGVNRVLIMQISKTYALKGFTGNPKPGTRKGSAPFKSPLETDEAELSEQHLDNDVAETELSGQHLDNDMANESDEELDDTELRDIGGLVDYVSGVS